MASSRKEISRCIFFGIWILILHATESMNENRFIATERGAPLIRPIDSDVTVEVGQNFTLECECNVPVTWKPFTNFDGEHDIQLSHTPEAYLPHGSILTLINVNYKYVGFFYCIKIDSKDPKYEEDDQMHIERVKADYAASEIYVFIDDPVHLLVDDSEMGLIVGTQYQDVIVPCRPTSKNVLVELIRDNQMVRALFYPFQGFQIKSVMTSESGQYICYFKHTVNRTDAKKTFYVTINTSQDYINKPTIMSATNQYGTQGDQLHLNCSVDVGTDVLFSINWILPNNNASLHQNRAVIGPTQKTKHAESLELMIGHSTLTVNDINKNDDQGDYKCVVVDHAYNTNSNQISIDILDKNESSIELWEPSGKYKIEISSKKTEAKWRVRYKGHPKPTLSWTDNRGVDILWSNSMNKEDKYEISDNGAYTMLKIKHPELRDTGIYTLKAVNGMKEVSKGFELVVKDKPSVSLNDTMVRPGKMAQLVCECAGYPPSVIQWTYIPCPISQQWPNECDNTKITRFGENQIETSDVTVLAQRSELNFYPTEPGTVECSARNDEGSDSLMAKVRIADLDESFSVWGINENEQIATGDQVTISCGVLVYDYSTELSWYFDGTPVQVNDNVIIQPENTSYSYRNHLTWKSISLHDTGTYECRANFIANDTTTSRTIYVQVHEAEAPQIDDTNLDDDKPMKKALGEPLRLHCKFTGIPVPRISWYKDGVLLVTDGNDTHIDRSDDSSILYFKFIKIEDEGEYKCEAANRLGIAAQRASLKISNLPKISTAWIIGITALILILIISTVYLCYRVRRERKLLREMKAAGLADFEKGNPDSINPELALDEQAELLPYDKKYEFPREKLKLGKQLGAGAFGVVLKAIAHGILPYEEETTVAVKMVKHTADNEIMRALVLELKIMVHMGQHLNVVNLLGAVTKNIAKREVMVIVEYCRFGNVQNFLIKHRDVYVDQIVPETDTIDPNILTKEARWSNDSGYEYNRQGLKYVKLNFSNNDNHANSGKLGASARKSGGQPLTPGFLRNSGMADYFPGGMDSANTEAELIPVTGRTSVVVGEDNVVLSNNSVQPAWRSNYKMDYKGPQRNITTTDLVCWSFQIARGMDYLSSRKVLHGDLAARNILLCDDNVVKICDFGLARSMYKSDNYKKKGEAPLPFKWLAIESIGDQVFSTFSDVWSFGIVMWELFSLGKVPYPGMTADQGLYLKLKDGYRMEKPMYATHELYDIMLKCWSANPESRPLFNSLEKMLGKLLENGVSEHYIDLNEPYLQMNIDEYSHGKTDYLSTMAPPDGLAPAIPTYVNSSAAMMPNNVPDFLHMNQSSGNVIFRPDSGGPSELPATPSMANNLDANVSSTKASPTKRMANSPEEMPMLNNDRAATAGDSDTESPPSAAAPPKPTPRTSPLRYGELNNRNGSSNAKDDYVNVPSTIINMDHRQVKKDAVSNPGYVVLGTTNETRT